jgi:prevent-host-death family protein
MKIIATTEARRHFSELINKVRYTNTPVAIGRHNKGEVLIIKFPGETNPLLDETTNFNQYAGAFDWLQDEPDIYSAEDLETPYV